MISLFPLWIWIWLIGIGAFSALGLVITALDCIITSLENFRETGKIKLLSSLKEHDQIVWAVCSFVWPPVVVILIGVAIVYLIVWLLSRMIKTVD